MCLRFLLIRFVRAASIYSAMLLLAGCGGGGHAVPANLNGPGTGASPVMSADTRDVSAALVQGDPELREAIASNTDGTVPLHFTALKGYLVPSFADAGGRTWLSSVDISGVAPSFLGRIDGPASVTLFPLDVNSKGALTAFGLLADPATSGPTQKVLFSWGRLTSSPNGGTSESGLGLAGQADPAHPQLFAGQNPGDQLYAPALKNGFNNPLAYTVENGRLWSYNGLTFAGTGVWSVSYPFKAPLDAQSVAASPGSFVPIPLSGKVWFLNVTALPNPRTLANVSAANSLIQSAPLSVQANDLQLGTGGSFWASSFASMTQLSSDGSVVSVNPVPRFQLDPLVFTRSAASNWSFSRDAANLYIVRSRDDGALSWFALPRPPNTGSYTGNYAVSAMHNSGKTVYAALALGGPVPALLSLDKTRLISAWPFATKLKSGGTQDVGVFEANFAGAFISAVTTTAVVAGPVPVCPITVTRRSGHVYTIKSTGALSKGCAVTLTDSDHFATALITVNPA